MLLLSRRKNEKIVVDNRITITVVQVRGGRVRLGIDAPAEVPVRRSELAAGRHGPVGRYHIERQ